GKVPLFPNLVVLLYWQSASFPQFSGFAILAKCLFFPILWFCYAGKKPHFPKLVVLLCWQSTSFDRSRPYYNCNNPSLLEIL
ncbi:MAG: hypothetical protein SPK32_07260, partial [Bacteroidaceae bacterium]|nr:hypothetical protein [Bacteroidaceae bacterium]